MFGLGGRILVGSALRLSLGRAYKNTVTSYSPIGYWRLGEPSGTNAVDETGNQDGTYVNTPTLGASSLIHSESDTSTTFVGTNSEHVIAVDQTAFNIPHFSVSAVIQISAAPAAQQEIVAVADSVNSVTVDKTLRLQADGRVAFYVFDGQQETAISADPIPLDEPVHIVGTIDGTGFARIYVNGVEAGTEAATGSHTGFTTASIVIGGGVRTSPVVHFDGTIDEVAVFDRGLTAAEVLGLYNVGTPAPTYRSVVLDLSPERYWRLGESAGTTATDETGNQDGTYVGAPTLGVTGAIVDDTDTAITTASGKYVNVGTRPTTIDQLSTFSLDVWIKTTDVTNAIISDFTGSAGFHLGLDSLGDIDFYLANTWATNNIFMKWATTLTVNDGEWHHVILTHDGTGTTAGITLYIDGVIADVAPSVTHDNLVTAVPAGFDTLIGRHGAGAGGYEFIGSIDEVAIYPIELNSTEVAEIYATGT